MNYKIVGPNLISCCAWCFPGASVLKACPELKDTVQISHGVCAMHRAAFLMVLEPKGPTVEQRPALIRT